MKTHNSHQTEPIFIGIDYHKRYSVFCVIDAEGAVVQRGRIEHAQPGAFVALVKRWPGSRVVFEAGMNWHWLYEILEGEMAAEDIVLANPYKTRIIAEAQVKTDKVDAFILAQLLRGNLISSVHIGSRENRRRKEVLRQRAFFVRQRTMLRNRIHRLLGGQHEVKLPQCSDLFGKKGLSFLEGLELPAPGGLPQRPPRHHACHCRRNSHPLRQPHRLRPAVETGNPQAHRPRRNISSQPRARNRFPPQIKITARDSISHFASHIS
jgi:transposase